MIQEFKAAIEVTTTHSDSMPLVIERNHRRDDEITLSCSDIRSGNRFPEAENVLVKFGIGSEPPKYHIAVHAYDWRENALFCAPRALNDGSRVNFVVARQIADNSFAGHKLVRANHFLADF
ncbi:MAG: hypothetical protein OEU90_02345 [Gammaproteobacteria bacterium]|nr:hypothetical protein [Gammaproteobacteria bacterium]MDH3804292.1 hypothetical protein [Gammaproteobacteria bacterium]